MSLAHRLARAHAHFICAHAGWILTGIILLSIAAFPFARRLKLKANLIDLLPPTMPSVVHLNHLTDEVGGTSFLVVVMESKDEESARLAAERFSQQAEAFDGIDYVNNRTNLSAFQTRKLLFLTQDSLKQLDRDVQDLIGHYRRKNNPFFIDLLNEAPPTLDLDSIKLEEKLYAIGGFAEKEKDLMEI